MPPEECGIIYIITEDVSSAQGDTFEDSEDIDSAQECQDACTAVSTVFISFICFSFKMVISVLF